jgi:polyferredoxin
MPSLEELQQEVEAIKKRNQRVEADKAWETSWARRVLILFLTYIVIVVFLFFAELPKPFINAIIPAIAFVLSTLSVSLLKNWWLRKR